MLDRLRILVALLGLAPAAVAAALPAAPTPQTPAPPSPLAARAADAVGSNALPAFRAAVEADLTQALADLQKLDAGRVTALAAYREFARYFGSIQSPSPADRETLAWLAVQPKLLPVLMTAVSDADAPERVLAVLTALRANQGDRLNEYADLAAAVCVVWDDPPKGGAYRPGRSEPAATSSSSSPRALSAAGGSSTRPSAQPAADPRAAVKRFRHYADPNRRFRCDVKALPWQALVYLVDVAIGDEEVAWAAKAYGGRQSLSRVYFEVPYDTTAFRRGERQADALPYTLPNIRKFGGVCLDQAYFAANVGKALGQPATICVGQSGGQGELHAWIGFVQPAGRGAPWNFYEGRYAGMMFWTGQVSDPQGGPPLTDADVSLASELTLTPPEKRLASAALVKAHDLVPATRAAELYTTAINLSPGNRPAWMGLADLGAAGRLSVEQINQVTQVVHRFAVQRYPDFAFAVYRRIVAGRSVDEQLVAMGKIAKEFPLRPDLVATVKVAQGDLLRQAKRHKEALSAYTEAMADAQRVGPVLPQAMERADALLRETGETPKLAELYRAVWSRTPPPQPSGYADLTPFCIIGRRYAALLREINRPNEAAGSSSASPRTPGGGRRSAPGTLRRRRPPAPCPSRAGRADGGCPCPRCHSERSEGPLVHPTGHAGGSPNAARRRCGTAPPLRAQRVSAQSPRRDARGVLRCARDDDGGGARRVDEPSHARRGSPSWRPPRHHAITPSSCARTGRRRGGRCGGRE